jgi:hypothetical protein
MIKIYNSLTEHSVKIKTKLKVNNEDDFERLDEWCNDNLCDHGFYELDEYGKDYIIQIDDDANENPDWKNNFDIVVEKVKAFLTENNL